MIIKWIVCKVQPEKRDSFSFAQAKWAGLSDVPGFVGQLGGWDLRSANTACIIGLWENESAYSSFMRDKHDTIYEGSHQASTYESIAVSLFEPIYAMPGSRANMVSALKDAKVVRVADCLVRPERVEHFQLVQQEIWVPGMSSAPGMLGGSFNKASAAATARYLVTTLWESEEQHESYTQTMLPGLRTAANVDDDVEGLTGHLIELKPDWFILSKSPSVTGTIKDLR